MRTPRFQILILMMSLGLLGVSQTPEQQKMMEEMEENMAEAMRMQDSLMNTPDMKNLMGQIQGQEKNNKAEREKENALKQEQESKIARNRLEDFYWRNKVASNSNGKFADWKWGNVDIAIYDGDKGKNSEGDFIDNNFIIIGSISANGQVTINLPPTIRMPYSISKSLIPEMHSVYNQDVTYSNPDVPYRWPGFSLSIIKDNNSVGTILIGNSERTTYNLAAPCCLNYGDEGYRLYWVYAEGSCTAQLKKEFKQNKLFNGEAERIVDQSIVYDLDFKPGWNLIKTEVRGNYQVGDRFFYKDKIHTVVPAMPYDARYYFKYDD